jgi:hypothetical protein
MCKMDANRPTVLQSLEQGETEYLNYEMKTPTDGID